MYEGSYVHVHDTLAKLTGLGIEVGWSFLAFVCTFSRHACCANWVGDLGVVGRINVLMYMLTARLLNATPAVDLGGMACINVLMIYAHRTPA